MRYVIAASLERMVDECRSALHAVTDVEFRVGSVAGAGADCDAAILSSPLAHERYGGRPTIEVAQVLVNERGDGAPRIILAAPPVDPDKLTSPVGDNEVVDFVFRLLKSCASEYAREFPDRVGKARILIHLEAAGIDRRELGAPIGGISKFLQEGPPGVQG